MPGSAALPTHAAQGASPPLISSAVIDVCTSVFFEAVKQYARVLSNGEIVLQYS